MNVSHLTVQIRKRITLTLLPVLVVLSSCAGLPDGVTPVTNFQIDRYLGQWYEIARLDHKFERGLSRVTATYEENSNGTVRVLNKGYSEKTGEWQEAEGKAKFVGDSNTGHLKVSFFGPFYGSYAVFELDADYQYAFIAGNSTKYLWLLSRTPTVDDAVYESFVEQAGTLGFDVDGLIRVDQSEVE